MIIAVQPDDYSLSTHRDKRDSSSEKWARYIESQGHKVKWVNVYQADILEQIKGCDGFMWRWAQIGDMRQIAHRLLPVLERELGMLVFPDQNTCWHYDDKVSQSYLFDALKIPYPKTWVWFDKMDAINWAKTAKYPLVLKLSLGASSRNVKLIKNFQEAKYYIEKLFFCGIEDITSDSQNKFYKWFKKVVAVTLNQKKISLEDVQHHYVLFQEFVPNNSFDTRVTVIGNRAFAYRRFNRKNDFRASGSGNFDTDPTKVDQRFVRLAFKISRLLRTQSLAVDCLWKDSRPIITEISYTFVNWMVRSCPGHWVLNGDPEIGNLEWKQGQTWPEEAQVMDFLKDLEKRQNDKV